MNRDLFSDYADFGGFDDELDDSRLSGDDEDMDLALDHLFNVQQGRAAAVAGPLLLPDEDEEEDVRIVDYTHTFTYTGPENRNQLGFRVVDIEDDNLPPRDELDESDRRKAALFFANMVWYTAAHSLHQDGYPVHNILVRLLTVDRHNLQRWKSFNLDAVRGPYTLANRDHVILDMQQQIFQFLTRLFNDPNATSSELFYARFITGNIVISEINVPQGGCESYAHASFVGMDGKGWGYNVQYLHSKDNNCALVAIRRGLRDFYSRHYPLSNLAKIVHIKKRQKTKIHSPYLDDGKGLSAQIVSLSLQDKHQAKTLHPPQASPTPAMSKEQSDLYHHHRTRLGTISRLVKQSVLLIDPKAMISLSSMQELSNFYAIQLSIVETSGAAHDYHPTLPWINNSKDTLHLPTIKLLLNNKQEHFCLVKGKKMDQVEQRKEFLSKHVCVDCGRIQRKNHRCLSREEEVMARYEEQARLALRFSFQHEYKDVDAILVEDGNIHFSEDDFTNVQRALRLLVEKEFCIVIHGAGGTGKSFITDYLCKQLRSSHLSVVITSSTGLSASLLDEGVTLHSLVGVFPSDLSSTTLSDGDMYQHALSLMMKRPTYFSICQRVMSMDVLIIDEISRIGDITLDFVDFLFQHIRSVKKPFGGVRVIFIGDVFQCTPINSRWFWESKVWTSLRGRLFPLLTTVGYRFKDDPAWFKDLNSLRYGLAYPQLITRLKERLFSREYLDNLCANDSTILRVFPTNMQVQAWNKKCIERQPDSERRIEGMQFDVKNKKMLLLTVDGERPPPRTLLLANKCPVILLTNRFQRDHHIANGSIGFVSCFGYEKKGDVIDTVSALLTKGERVMYKQWLGDVIDRPSYIQVTFKVRGEEMSVSLPPTITKENNVYTMQFPFRLAFALTIDKCQGLTLDKIAVDMNKLHPSACGKMYVALSRVRNMNDCYLTQEGWDWNKFRCCLKAMDFESYVKTLQTNMKDVDIVSLPTPNFNDSAWSLKHYGEYANCISNETFDPLPTVRMKFYDYYADATPLLLKKTCFYDLETCTRDGQYGHQPYYNCLSVFTNGEEVDRQVWRLGKNTEDVMLSTFTYLEKMWTADCDEFKTVQDAYNACKSKGGGGVKRKRYVTSLLARLTTLRRPFYLCAFNGSGFDFHWLMQFLCQSPFSSSRFNTRTMFKGSKLVICDIIDTQTQKIALRIHDVCNVIQCSLDRACKEFLDDKFGRWKGCFPHSFVDKHGPQVVWNDTVSLTLDDFGPSGSMHREKAEQFLKWSVLPLHDLEIMAKQGYFDEGYIPLLQAFSLSHYRIHDELEWYGPRDVDALIEVYKSVDAVCGKVTGTSVLRFSTASSMSWYAFIKYLPTKFTFLSRASRKITKLYRVTFDENKFFRRAVKGGKVFPRVKNWKSSNLDAIKEGTCTYKDIDDYLVYLDISGMYVYIMKTFSFPYDAHSECTPEECQELFAYLNRKKAGEWCEEDFLEMPMCVLEVEASLHEQEVEPCVPFRKPFKDEGGGDEDFKRSSIVWMNGKREDVYTSIDIKLILLSGGSIHKVKRGVKWKHAGNLFKQWMMKTLEGKEKAQKEGKKALRSMWKLMGNSTFGGVLKRDFHNVVRHVKTIEERDDFFKDCQWENILDCSNGSYIMTGENHNYESEHWRSSRLPYIGAFILSYSRMMLESIIRDGFSNRCDGTVASIKHQVFYGDTDSLIVHCSVIPKVKQWIKNENGFMTDDLCENDSWCQNEQGEDITTHDDYDHTQLRFTKLVSMLAPAPKSYGGEYVTANAPSKVSEFWKFKGVPKYGISFEWEGETKTSLTLPILRSLYETESSLQIKKQVIKKISFKRTKKQEEEDVKHFTLHNINLLRTLFKTRWSGRKCVTWTGKTDKHEYTVPIDWKPHPSCVEEVQFLSL